MRTRAAIVAHAHKGAALGTIALIDTAIAVKATHSSEQQQPQGGLLHQSCCLQAGGGYPRCFGKERVKED